MSWEVAQVPVVVSVCVQTEIAGQQEAENLGALDVV